MITSAQYWAIETYYRSTDQKELGFNILSNIKLPHILGPIDESYKLMMSTERVGESTTKFDFNFMLNNRAPWVASTSPFGSMSAFGLEDNEINWFSVPYSITAPSHPELIGIPPNLITKGLLDVWSKDVYDRFFPVIKNAISIDTIQTICEDPDNFFIISYIKNAIYPFTRKKVKSISAFSMLEQAGQMLRNIKSISDKYEDDDEQKEIQMAWVRQQFNQAIANGEDRYLVFIQIEHDEGIDTCIYNSYPVNSVMANILVEYVNAMWAQNSQVIVINA